MSTLCEVKHEMIELLNAHSGLYEVRAIGEFDGNRKGSDALPIITVGIDGVELSPAGFGGYFGSQNGSDISGNFAAVTFSFQIHIDEKEKNLSCHQIFEQLCTVLITSSLPLSRISCEQVDSVKNRFVNQLTAKAEFLVLLTSSGVSQQVRDFVLKRSDYHD